MIIAVLADKGGVGKTTTAHNLGAEIASQGRKVLLIDADKQADLTCLCGVEPHPNIGMDAILRQMPTPSVASYLLPVSDNLSLIGTHPLMRKADRELAQRTRREYVLQDALHDVLSDFHAVVIDVGHSDMVQLNVMAIADAMVIPTTPAKLDADHIINMIDEASAMRQDLRLPSLMHPQRVVVSITRRGANSGIESAGVDLIGERFAQILAPAVVPFTPRAMEASAMRMTFRKYLDEYGTQRDRALSAAVDAYAQLADRVLALAPAEVAA